MMNRAELTVFEDKVAEEVRGSLQGATRLFEKGYTGLCGFFRGVADDAKLTGEGLVHLREASDEVRSEFRRDLTTCAVETGMAIAEDVAIEVSIAVNVLEVGEKVLNSPPEKVTMGMIAKELVEGIAPNTIAAIAAGMEMLADLEKSGMEWEERHLPKATGAPALPLSPPSI